MTELSKKYEKKFECLIKRVDSEYLLIPINQETVDLDSAFVLSETGAYIFDQIDGKRSVSDIVSLMCENFEVSEKDAREDVTEFLDQIADQFLK